MSLFTALKVDRPWQFLVAIESATGNTRNFLILNDGPTILDHSDHSPEQRNIEALPFPWLTGLFGGRGQETIHSAGMMARRFLDGVGFNLDFVATAQIHAAVGVGRRVELDMQLEIFEVGIVDNLGATSRAY